MKKSSLLFVLTVGLLAGFACKRDLVPGEVLEKLHKPLVTSVNPTVVRTSGGGFLLTVMMELTEDEQYVFYIGEHKVGQVSRGERSFAANAVGCMVTKGTLDALFAVSPNGGTFSVRVTGINGNYDISGDFDRYRDYVSEPVAIEIQKGETQFSAAKHLFPEWTHSSQPIVRCNPQGNICLAWLEKLNGVDQAFFSFSADSGETWSQVLNISRSGASVANLDLAADGAGHFYMTWNAADAPDVYFCRSLDNGATWHFPVRMDAEGEAAAAPALAVDDLGGVHLAWRFWDGASAGFTNRLAVSRDLGNSWEERNFAIPSSYTLWRPLLSARAGGVLDLLQGRPGSSDGGLFLDHFQSLDYGNHWQERQVAAGSSSPGDLYPLLRFGPGNRMYIVWGAYSYAGHNYSHWNFFLNRTGDGSWGTIQDLHQVCPASDERTALSVSARSVDTVLTGPGCLYLLRSTNEGDSWPVPEAVAGSEGFRIAGDQDMASHPAGKTFLVFIEKTGEEGRLYLTSFE